MGAKYRSQTEQGFNSNPPPDDGSEITANEMTWAKHLIKLALPILNFAKSINEQLVTAFNVGPVVTNSNLTLNESHNAQFIEVSAGATITLPQSSTLDKGWYTTVINTDISNPATIRLFDTSPDAVTDTLRLVINGTLTLAPQQSVTLINREDQSGYVSSGLESTPDTLTTDQYPRIKTNTSDPDNDIDFVPGIILDSNESDTIRLTSLLTKKLDTDWVEGTDEGGIPPAISPVQADTWYYAFLIKKVNGDVDAGVDVNISATNLLAVASDYATFQLVGFFRTDGSGNITPFSFLGNTFSFQTSYSVVSNVSAPLSPTQVSLPVPANIKGIAEIFVSATVAGSGAPVPPGDNGAVGAVLFTDGNLANGRSAVAGTTVATSNGHIVPRTSAGGAAATVPVPFNLAGQIWVDGAVVPISASTSAGMNYTLSLLSFTWDRT